MKNNPEKLRRKYPHGAEVTLELMDGYPQMLPGLKGTVDYIDDIGQIFVKWENGSLLPLNPELDRFSVKRVAYSNKD